MCWLFVVVPRYPVILNSFGLRRGSGGGGARPGGDGVARSMTFRKPLTVSVLSERRAFRPWGLAGGLPAERGVSKKRKREGAIIARHPIPHYCTRVMPHVAPLFLPFRRKREASTQAASHKL